MNTVFKIWKSKFLFTKVQQLWKRSYEELKVFKNANKCYTFSVSHSYSSFKLCGCDILGLTSADNIYMKQVTRLLNTSKNRCWKCNGVVADRDLVCMSCGCIQEPKQGLNYFEIFKEIPHFDIDTRNLTVKFRRLQTLLHPDKFAIRSEKEKEYSAAQSARVNKAYNTLLCPVERGLYLLELYGKPLQEDEIQLPSDFLMNIMEINEELEKCKSPDILESIRHMNDARLEMLLGDVSLSFKEKNILKARTLLSKLKYFMNIDAKIRELEDKLGVIRDY